MYEPLEVSECKKGGKVLAELKELIGARLRTIPNLFEVGIETEIVFGLHLAAESVIASFLGEVPIQGYRMRGLEASVLNHIRARLRFFLN